MARRILAIVFAMLIPLASFPQNKGTKELIRQIEETKQFDKRRPLYFLLLDKLPTGYPERDEWCRRFLLDAKQNGNAFAMGEAAREITNTVDTTLLAFAIDELTTFPRQTPIGRNIRLVLSCQLYSFRVRAAGMNVRKRWLEDVMAKINNIGFSSLSNHDKYYRFYQAHIIHTMLDEKLPHERFASQMVALSKEMGWDAFNTPLNMALSISSEMNLLNSRYQSCLEQDRQLLSRINNLDNAYKKMGRKERNYDFIRYTLYNRMLICNFALHHTIDEECYRKADSLHNRDLYLQGLEMQRASILPVFKAIHDGDIQTAYSIHKQHLDKIKSREEALFDFEYDLCTWIDLKRGDYQRALFITLEQDSVLTGWLDFLHNDILQEKSLNDQWASFRNQEQIFRYENDIRLKNYEEKLLEEQMELNRMRQDSLLSIETLRKMEVDNESIEQEGVKARRELQEMKRKQMQSIIAGGTAAFIVIMLFLVVVVIYDIRLRKANKALMTKQLELRKQRDIANESSRLKMFFLQNMSHDIRNPIAAIQNFCDLLTERIRQTEGDEGLLEECAIISDNSKQLTHLMNTTLDISALESGKYKPALAMTPLLPLLKESVNVVEQRRKRKITFDFALPQDFTLNTDGKRFAQVVELLLNNACKFAPNGEIRLCADKEGDKVVVSVEDNGPGIPPDKTETIFRRFVKLDMFSTGAGLGLSLCRVIAQALKGSVEVDTTYKAGARFCFRHPMAIVMAFLFFFATASKVYAQDILAQKALLDEQLSKATSDEERVQLLRDLCDVTFSMPEPDRKQYAVDLLKAELKAGEASDVFRAARNVGNIDDLELRRWALNSIRSFPDSPDKRMSVTSIKCRIAVQEMRSMKIHQKDSLVQSKIEQMRSRKAMDPFERYELAFLICNLSTEKVYSFLVDQYSRELIKLSEEMKMKDNTLESLALMIGIDLCIGTHEYRRGITYANRLLDIVMESERDFRERGRKYRDFTGNKIFCYLKLAHCMDAMTEQEKYGLLNSMQDLVKQHPEVMKLSYAKLQYNAALLGSEKNWTEFLPIAEEVVSISETLRNLPEDADYTLYGYDEFLLGNVIKTFEALKDTVNIVKSRQMRIDYKRRLMRNVAHSNFRHIGLYANILSMENELSRMKMQRVIQEERERLDHERLQNELQNLRLNQLEDSLKQVESRRRNDRLHSQVTKAHEELMLFGHNRYLLRYFILCSMLALSLAGFLVALFYSRTLNKKRKKLKKIEDMLLKSVEMANKSNEERNNFIQNINHETRTPLNAILGFSRHLCEEVKGVDKDEMELYNYYINQNCDMVITLINDIIDLSVLQSGQYNMNFEQCRISEIIILCVGSVTHKVEKGVELITENLVDENMTIETDRIRLQQLILNLLTNACKYCKEGSIRVKAELSGNDMLQVSVEDTGIGIMPENAEKIFNRFEKNNSMIAGSGLGLHICRLIATRLNAKVFLDTTYKSGARFVLQHPLSQK